MNSVLVYFLFLTLNKDLPTGTLHEIEQKVFFIIYFIILEVTLHNNNFLKNLANSQENTCVRASFLIKLQVSGLKKTLTQVFSCEFC